MRLDWKAVRGRALIVGLVMLGAMVWLPSWSWAYYRCPHRWNPRLTRGVHYLLNFNAAVGFRLGKERAAGFDSDFLTIDANADLRGRIGRFVLGAEGDFRFDIGKNGRHVQQVDLHLGGDIATYGRTYYRMLLSRRYLGTVYGYRRRVSFYRTRYCNQTQGFARHHQITAGPKLLFTQASKGLGAQINYRFMWAKTRSRWLMFLDFQLNYGALNLLEGEGDLAHAFGVRFRFGYAWRWLNSFLTASYFAGEFTVQLGVGLSIWDA